MPPDVEAPDSSLGTEVEEDFQDISLDSLTAEQDTHWRLTGELPGAKKADPPPAAKPKGEEPSGNQDAGKGKGIKQRIPELDGEIQELETRLARKAELKRQLSEDGAKPTEKAPPAEIKPPELKAPARKRVEIKDFNTFEEFEAAKEKASDEYYEALADYKADLKLTEFARKQAEIAERTKQEAEGKTVADAWNKRVDAASKKVGIEEWNQSAEAIAPLLGKDPRFAAGASFVLDSEVGPELSHYLGTHLDEAEEIAGLSPIQQVKRLTLIEATLTKPTAKPAPPGTKKVTETPPPPTELAGRNQLAPDPVAAAIEADDTEAYIREANARELAEIAAGKRRR